ncbi:MAG: TetR/AcrR family transcriptional regulator [Candidatus Marinimicrobia bacterium]|nr:TetR/AcrR family transcriptional regulator [Candidatus Neomarinimicrobiota bacterium]
MEFTDRQKEIINAAIQLIAEKGIQQLTIKNLSQKIGIVEGAIYRHFNSKIDILLGILTSFEHRIGTMGEKFNAASGEDAVGNLQTIFANTFKNFKTNPALAAVIFSEEIFQNDKKLSQKVFSIMQKNQATLQSIIRAGQQAGTIRDDISEKQLTLVLTGSLRLLVTEWRLSEYAFDLTREGKKLWISIGNLLTK